MPVAQDRAKQPSTSAKISDRLLNRQSLGERYQKRLLGVGHKLGEVVEPNHYQPKCLLEMPPANRPSHPYPPNLLGTAIFFLGPILQLALFWPFNLKRLPSY